MLAFWPALQISFPLPRLPRSQGPSCPRRQSIATPGEWRSWINTDEVFGTRKNEGLQLSHRPLPRIFWRASTLIDAIENGSIDLALRYEISVGFPPRLEPLARHRRGRTRAAACCRLRPVSAESDDRHGRA